MIVVCERALVAETPVSGGCAYIDAEWVPDGYEGPVPFIVAVDDGSAAMVIGSLAQRVAQAAGRTAEILGRGAVAQAVSALVGSVPAGSPPSAIVDTTGSPEAIAHATRRLGDLGVLVLAGESVGRQLDLDLYPDVHCRGLRIVGIPLPEDVGGPVHVTIDPPARVAPGDPLPRSARWYTLAP